MILIALLQLVPVMPLQMVTTHRCTVAGGTTPEALIFSAALCRQRWKGNPGGQPRLTFLHPLQFLLDPFPTLSVLPPLDGLPGLCSVRRPAAGPRLGERLPTTTLQGGAAVGAMRRQHLHLHCLPHGTGAQLVCVRCVSCLAKPWGTQ